MLSNWPHSKIYLLLDEYWWIECWRSLLVSWYHTNLFFLSRILMQVTPKFGITLRRNRRDGVSNQQRPDGLLTGANQRKHQNSASLAFVRGIQRGRWIPLTKGQLHRKCFHLMTSSWYNIANSVFLSVHITNVRHVTFGVIWDRKICVLSALTVDRNHH